MDSFQIVLGHYLFYVHHHEGQWSRAYSRLSKILGYFNPRGSHQFLECLEEEENWEAKEVYDHLKETWKG